MTGQPVFLKVYHSEKLVTSRQFLSDQISIGSSADGPSLVLADPSVCFWHALIERRGDKYCISDLGSPTGTFVNSKQVLESPLKHGDKIQVGDFTIHFFINVPFLKADLQNVKPAKGKKSDKPVRSAASRKKQKPQPQVTSTPPGFVSKPKPKIEPEPEPRIELEPESVSPTTASEPQSQTPRPPADLKKAPSISKTTSERVSSEIQPSQEVQCEDINVPTEFVISPLSKIKKKRILILKQRKRVLVL